MARIFDIGFSEFAERMHEIIVKTGSKYQKAAAICFTAAFCFDFMS